MEKPQARPEPPPVVKKTILDTAALNTVKQWRFVPGKKGDAAVLM
jgi:hypothetical protein